jgi:ribosomal protein S20
MKKSELKTMVKTVVSEILREDAAAENSAKKKSLQTQIVAAQTEMKALQEKIKRLKQELTSY